MNPFFTEKRKWNLYSNKTFKTFKVYEIILNKRWGKVSWKPCLKLFSFRTLKILWFNCFRLKKHTCMYCQIRFGILYCSGVFFIVILISVSNISPRIKMKRKNHSRRNKTTLYLRLKTCWKFPHKREHQTSTSLWELGLYLGGVAKSHARAACVRRRDCEGRGERRVLSRLALLSSRLNENSCLAHHSLSWQFRSIVEPWRFSRFPSFIGYWYYIFTSILT